MSSNSTRKSTKPIQRVTLCSASFDCREQGWQLFSNISLNTHPHSKGYLQHHTVSRISLVGFTCPKVESIEFLQTFMFWRVFLIIELEKMWLNILNLSTSSKDMFTDTQTLGHFILDSEGRLNLIQLLPGPVARLNVHFLTLSLHSTAQF